MSLTITLEGFGCYRDKSTFTFSDKSLTLLKGVSGEGKSTLLEAICFALYNTPKKITWGEKKCKVIVVHGNWTVTRTRGPNSLILIDRSNSCENIYKETEAQDLIYERFGAHFQITSYITQDQSETFFSLGPNDRMAFLEKLAIGDVNIGDIKKNVKNVIKERRDRLKEAAAKLMFTQGASAQHPEPLEVAFPLTGSYSEIKIKNETIRRKRNIKQLAEASQQLTDLTAAKARADLARQKRETLETQCQHINDQVIGLQTEIESLPSHDIEAISKHLESLTLNRELTKLRLSVTTDTQQYQALSVIESSQLQEEHDRLMIIPVVPDRTAELKAKNIAKQRVLTRRSKIAELEKRIDNLDTVENYIEAIEDLQSREQDILHQKLRYKDRAIIHKCPKCQAFLRMDKNKLEMAEAPQMEEDRKSEKELDSELKQLRSDRGDYEESVRELKLLSNSLAICLKEPEETVNLELDYDALYSTCKESLYEQDIRQERIRSLKRKIDNKEYSATFQALSRRLELRQAEIKKLELALRTTCIIDEKESEETLQRDLVQAKLTEQKRELLSSQLLKLTSQLRTIEKTIGSLEALDERDYKEEIKSKTLELQELKENEKAFKEREVKLNAYLEYYKAKGEYSRWRDELEEIKKEEENARTSLSVSERFLRKVEETESAAVINTIENINHHLQFYLDKFFSNPINVEIRSFKDTKSGEEKPNVNIVVWYRGYECEVKHLSGGERARVELAICLAINALCDSPILLLDECFSSLNEELAEEIIELLKGIASDQGKLIIVVAHQTNENCYDSTIEL